VAGIKDWLDQILQQSKPQVDYRVVTTMIPAEAKRKDLKITIIACSESGELPFGRVVAHTRAMNLNFQLPPPTNRGHFILVVCVVVWLMSTINYYFLAADPGLRGNLRVKCNIIIGKLSYLSYVDTKGLR